MSSFAADRPVTQQLSSLAMRYSSLGLATGNDFSNTACTRVKMAVVAPIPKARVSTAVAVKPGAFENCRIAYRASSMSCIAYLLWTETGKISVLLGRSRRENVSRKAVLV